jgi:hypothetical protein
MPTIRTLRRSSTFVLLALLTTSQVFAQGRAPLILPWQKPQVRDAADVEKIMGPVKQKEPSRDLNILWVWGIDQFHDPWKDAHEYVWAMDRFCYDLLPHVPRVTITPVYYWPTQEQWDNADLAVFYLMPHHDGSTGFNNGTEPEGDPRGIWDYDTIDAFQSRGGGLVFIHFSVFEGTGVELAKRIGLAWSKENPEEQTTLSSFVTTMTVTPDGHKSDILKNFPKQFELHDELYWPLVGDQSEITVLATAEGPKDLSQQGRYPQKAKPKPEAMDGKAWPVAWTKEVGKGRVFGTIMGHNFFAFNDPYFRIMLLRGMAWTMNESFDPFKPIVNVHLAR